MSSEVSPLERVLDAIFRYTKENGEPKVPHQLNDLKALRQTTKALQTAIEGRKVSEAHGLADILYVQATNYVQTYLPHWEQTNSEG